MVLPDYSYFSLIKGLLLLALVFGIVQVLKVVIMDASRLKSYRGIFSKVFRAIEFLLLPLWITMLAVVFVLVNPLQNGLIVGAVILIGFNSIRNFYSRFLLRSQSTFEVGDRLSYDGFIGVVLKIKTFSVMLQSKQGVTYIPYAALIKQPYTIIKDNELPKNMSLHAEYIGDEDGNGSKMLDLLINSQFLDLTSRPSVSSEGESKYLLKILLQNGVDLEDVQALLLEHNFKINR